MKVLVVGDSYFSAEAFENGLHSLVGRHDLEFMEVTSGPGFEASTPSERQLREYQGTPGQVASRLTDHEVLIVHGAPVTEEVLRASPRLGLVGCARGGPVNVDIEAARQLGVTVSTAPGKNAESVADLTLAFVLMLARGLPRAQGFLRSGNRLTSTFDGAEFFGCDLIGLTLGLIGCGRVAREVCKRALPFGMHVIAYDPLVDVEVIADAGANAASLADLVRAADIISLHARETSDNRHMIDAPMLSSCKPGAFLINTAREGLVDERAVVAALEEGQLAGAALDVFEPDGALSDLLASGSSVLGKIVVTPHIGGATRQALRRGAEMMAAEVERFSLREALLYAVN